MDDRKTTGNGLAAGCQLFYRKIYVFNSVKYFLVLWGHWVHFESSRKQVSLHRKRTLRSRDLNGEYYNFINQVISMLERKLDISILTRPILIV